jgi:radical SAM protein with 4Fe4S-binding SPASM domain
MTEINAFKSIAHHSDAYDIRPEAKEFPMMVVISFVYPCNAECPNCPYTNSNIREEYRDKPFMDEITFKKIADECGKHGAWIRISGGGEPMLHPQAIELIEYAKKVGAKIGLITNGSKFNETNSLRIVKAKVDMVEFSVDAADSETYAWARKGLNWGGLLDNVNQMVRLRNQIDSPTKIIASGINQNGVDIDLVEKFWRPLVDNFQKRKYLTWSFNDPSNSADPLPYLEPLDNTPCPFIFERLNIDSRGRIMLCGYDISATTNMGNIHKQSIQEVWNGKEFNFYRKKHLEKKGNEIEMCKNCPDWKYRSWNHNYWKVVDEADPNNKKPV